MGNKGAKEKKNGEQVEGGWGLKGKEREARKGRYQILNKPIKNKTKTKVKS